MRMKARRGLFYRWNPADKAILKQHLGPQGRLLLIVHTLFLLAEALSGAFVNVFLWKKAGDYALIALYNIAFFVAVQFAFMFSGKWVKVYNKMSCLKAGIAIAAAFYLFVLFLGDNAVRYIVPLGLLQGVGHGFFWLSFNIVLFEITSRENRDKFNGLAGVFGSFVGMAAPLIAGYFISVMTGATGYYMIFALSLAVYIAAAIFSVFFNRRKSGGQFSIRETRLIFQRDKTWRFIFLAMIGQGFNESVFHFLIGILVFVATNNEWKVGVYTAITSGVAFFSFYVAGKFLRPEWRHPSLFWGAMLTSVSVLPLFYKVNFATLLWMGVGVSLFSPLFLIPAISTVYDAIGRSNETAKWKVENIIIRETGLNVGRVASLALFIAIVSWREDPIVINSILLLVSLAQLMTWFYMRKIEW